MFERAVLVASALSLSLAQGPSAARSDDDVARLLRLSARADSLEARFDSLKALETARVGEARRAHVVRAGRLTAIFWSSVPDALARSILLRTDSILAAFGAIPDSFLAAAAPVQMWTTGVEAVLAQPDLRGRQRLVLDWAGRAEDTLSMADRLALEYGGRYLRRLDRGWQNYVWSYGIVWRPEYEGGWALRALTEESAVLGAELPGRPSRGLPTLVGSGFLRAPDPSTVHRQ